MMECLRCGKEMQATKSWILDGGYIRGKANKGQEGAALQITQYRCSCGWKRRVVSKVSE